MSTPGNKQSFLERTKQSVNDVYLQMHCCDGFWSCFGAFWFLPLITFVAAALFAASGWQCTSAPCEGQQLADRKGMQILAVIFALLTWFFSIICTCITWARSVIVQNASFKRRVDFGTCITLIWMQLPAISVVAVLTFGCCTGLSAGNHMWTVVVFIAIGIWFILVCWCTIREYRGMVLESRAHIDVATPLLA